MPKITQLEASGHSFQPGAVITVTSMSLAGLGDGRVMREERE